MQPGVYDKHSLVQTINPKQLKREFYAQPTGKAKVGLFAHGKEKENADGGKDMDKAKEHDLYMLDEEESRDNTWEIYTDWAFSNALVLMTLASVL